jgi:hypothetical protein
VTAYVRGAVPGDSLRGADLYALAWPATVIEQHADGTIDVTCDDARMGDLLSIPMVSGWPGSTLSLSLSLDGAGDVPAVPVRVRVRFAAASPALGYAESFEQDTLATAAVALVGDRVTIGTLSGVAPSGGGPVTFTFTPPVGPPQTGITITLLGKEAGPGSAQVKLR